MDLVLRTARGGTVLVEVKWSPRVFAWAMEGARKKLPELRASCHGFWSKNRCAVGASAVGCLGVTAFGWKLEVQGGDSAGEYTGAFAPPPPPKRKYPSGASKRKGNEAAQDREARWRQVRAGKALMAKLNSRRCPGLRRKRTARKKRAGRPRPLKPLSSETDEFTSESSSEF